MCSQNLCISLVRLYSQHAACSHVPVNHSVDRCSTVVPSNCPLSSSDMHSSNSLEPVLCGGQMCTLHYRVQYQKEVQTFDSLDQVLLFGRDLKVWDDQRKSGQMLGLGLGYMLQRANGHTYACYVHIHHANREGGKKWWKEDHAWLRIVRVLMLNKNTINMLL